MPRFTVVIPTHDHADLLRVSTGSVRGQTLSDFEVFIVGDGMDQSTREIAHEIAETDQRFRVFDLPKEAKRCARNRHQALLSADSEYAAYLDDDDFWLPNHLATLDAALKGADFAHTRLFMLHAHHMFAVFRDTLEDAATRQRMLAEPFNFFGPTQAAHRLSTYFSLPEGWRPPVEDIWNDLNMWRKFLSSPGVRFRSSRTITTLNFPSPARTGWSIQQRLEEMTFWSAIFAQPGAQERINSMFSDPEALGIPVTAPDHMNIWMVRAEHLVGFRDRGADVQTQ